MDDDDPVREASREISAAARAVMHGLAMAARAKAERRGGGQLNEARRLDERTQAIAALRGIEGHTRHVRSNLGVDLGR